jgi:hypothetical protein
MFENANVGCRIAVSAVQRLGAAILSEDKTAYGALPAEQLDSGSGITHGFVDSDVFSKPSFFLERNHRGKTMVPLVEELWFLSPSPCCHRPSWPSLVVSFG